MASLHTFPAHHPAYLRMGRPARRCIRPAVGNRGKPTLPLLALPPNDSSFTTTNFITTPGGLGPEEELALVSFHIPVASPDTDPRDVVVCPDVRDSLISRDSPLLPHDNFGGGFVDDEDRVALNTMRLSSIASSGATDMCVDLPESGILDAWDGGAVSFAWPVTRPVPPPSICGGSQPPAVASSVGAGQHGVSSRALVPLLDGECDVQQLQHEHTSLQSQGVSAAATRMPAIQAAAAAAVFAQAPVQPDGSSSSVIATGSSTRQLHNVSTLADRVCVSLPSWAMRAGPRKRIFFDPTRVSAAIVTCGHICPGVNDVVQGIVHRLTDYGVPEGQVLGICDGFKGFDPRHPAKPRPMTRQSVEGAHLRGGSLLGTSKGWADIDAVVAKIEMWDVNMLFVVGGDGGLRAAQLISEQCRAQQLPCCVVGVPKSIENDILLVDRTFGFETAVQEVQRPLLAAKVEASSIRGGIGLVKVMGRHSGFLAMQASLASGVVDVCLIPEVSFTMDGPHGLLAYLDTVLEHKGHAVVCVAEGAGQELISAHMPVTKDSLGNLVLHDIGVYLKTRFKLHFKDAAEVRYIDPTYMIRTTPCNSLDHIYARVLAHNAVDAAFSGFTGVTVGMCNNHYVLLPIPLVTQAPRRVDPWGKAWNRLRADSGQPSFHPPPSLGRAAVSSSPSDFSGSECSSSEGGSPPSSDSPRSSVNNAGSEAFSVDLTAGAPSPVDADVMASPNNEPVGPQLSMGSAAAAGSDGLYGGGAAISPAPADKAGAVLSDQTSEAPQENLPWPPMHLPTSVIGGEDNVGRSVSSGQEIPCPGELTLSAALVACGTPETTAAAPVATGEAGSSEGEVTLSDSDIQEKQVQESDTSSGKGSGALGALGAVLRGVANGAASSSGRLLGTSYGKSENDTVPSPPPPSPQQQKRSAPGKAHHDRRTRTGVQHDFNSSE